MEEIAVIIPVYRRPELLKEAALSVFQNTFLPKELVVVIDGANESSVDIDKRAAEEVFQKAPKELECKIVFSKAKNPGGARNIGIQKSQSPWIAFLDSDDLFTPDKLQKQINYLKTRPHLLACSTDEIWIKDGKKLEKPFRLSTGVGKFLGASFHNCLISPSSVMIHRKVFEKVGLFDKSFFVCEDFELWIRLLSRYSMGYIPEKLVVKRSGDWVQESSRYHSMDKLRIQAILKTMQNEKLSERETQEAKSACEQKFQILIAGAVKYNRIDEIEQFKKEAENILQAY